MSQGGLHILVNFSVLRVSILAMLDLGRSYWRSSVCGPRSSGGTDEASTKQRCLENTAADAFRAPEESLTIRGELQSTINSLLGCDQVEESGICHLEAFWALGVLRIDLFA